MKKIAMLLCAALMISMLASCGKDNPEPAGDTSSAASTGASQTTSMPSTPAEIYGHNMQIDESAISLKQFETPAAGSKIATIKTSLGDIKIARVCPAIKGVLKLQGIDCGNCIKPFQPLKTADYDKLEKALADLYDGEPA